MRKIGFVTPWYGKSIGGGAEAELRGLVHHLQAAGVSLEILTTCVLSFTSDWSRDEHPEGLSWEDGVPVRRFAVRRRDSRAFDEVNARLMRGETVSPAEEEIFCREMVNSLALMAYMREHAEEYRLFVFMPYLYGPIYYGCQIAPEKSVMIPCLHDEQYAHFACFREAFSRVRGMIFLSDPERELAERLYGVSGKDFVFLGAGVDTNWKADPERFRRKYGITDPFILYAGRKDAGKRVNVLARYFAEYRKTEKAPLKLILIGGGKLDIPDHEDILDLGFVDPQDKYDAYAAAAFFCNPSEMESFSIVLMESWLAGRPVLVNGESLVMRDFVRKTNGGLYYEHYGEFFQCVKYLLSHPAEMDQMGRNGRAYVQSHFNWDIITRKYRAFFDGIAPEAAPTEAAPENAEAGSRRKIAFVCQRYGLEVNGGSELYCREVAERLAETEDVTVYTTCAVDYATWRNEYPAGETELNGVRVKRFPTERERDQDRFDKAYQALLSEGTHTDGAEEKWILEQGPVCTRLVEALREEAAGYRAVFFMTYLYYPTVMGMNLNLPNAILIPTVHDEPTVYFRCYDTVFRNARVIVWNTPEERAFARKRFPETARIPSEMTGIGISRPAEPLPELPEELRGQKYILYIGRIDRSKGCAEMFAYFDAYRKQYGPGLKLALIGKAVMPVPEDPDVIHLGFIEENMKFTVIRHAFALVLFSRFESLSMVVLESMMMGIPVLVTGHSEVLKGHCVRSNAGLYFRSFGEFAESLKYLETHEDAYRQMGQNGVRYVEENYQWQVICRKYRSAIERLEAAKGGETA